MIDIKQLKENVSGKRKPVEATPPTETPVKTAAPTTTSNRSHTPMSTTPMAIGSTIHIKGDVTGDEDLIIHGRVEGQINLKDHNVIIGSNGKVKANIHARQIVVEGELHGDMNGEEKVIIRETGNVLGNVVSPRVTLEDGAMFKGSIEMEPRNNVKPVTQTESRTGTSVSQTTADSKAIA